MSVATQSSRRACASAESSSGSVAAGLREAKVLACNVESKMCASCSTRPTTLRTCSPESIAQLDAIELNRARLVLDEAGQHRGERGLPCATRPHEGNAAARLEVEVDGVERPRTVGRVAR